MTPVPASSPRLPTDDELAAIGAVIFAGSRLEDSLADAFARMSRARFGRDLARVQGFASVVKQCNLIIDSTEASDGLKARMRGPLQGASSLWTDRNRVAHATWVVDGSGFVLTQARETGKAYDPASHRALADRLLDCATNLRLAVAEWESSLERGGGG